ncbi:MAG: hypothetical protein KBG84_11915 [Planctomycetes bacterium]|nr:hypothetical protein [Planctomycetota bacterium]
MSRTTLGLLALMALLLAGCGPPRFFAVEEMNEAELRNTPSFNARDVEWNFKRPDTWEISDKDWNEMHSRSNSVYLRTLNSNSQRPIYLGNKDGATIEMTIKHIDRGHYTFFTYSPAVIEAHLLIKNASGKTLFKGTGKGRTRDGGWDKAGDGGRLDGAHEDVAWAIRDLLNYYDGKK